ncbi:MAG: glycosyltransferase [Salinivirgaceae bacterium]|nr:glycosyltransferase [Salinivirgaceae bacterium]
MKLSVALCTYNGERFIEEQLSSIINQSKKVDEIIVCDDCSSDRTVEIVKSISESNKDVDIRIYENEQNLGVCANFEKAVFLCNGDIIFLSDQDDIWNPLKVETTIKWFASNQDKSVVFTDADLIDADGKLLDGASSLWNYTGFSSKIQKQFDDGYSFEIIASKNRCTGATMAMMRSFVFKFSDYCDDKVLHDEVIAVAAAFQNQLGYITETLIQYRIHKGQSAGISMLTNSFPDKYSVNSKSEHYVGMNMSSKMKKRLDLFILRADIPKKAIVKIFRYLFVYGFSGFDFWYHDFLKLAVQIVNYKSK